MASVVKSAALVDNLSAGGKTDWTNPSNAQTSDDVYATSSLAKRKATGFLRAQLFGFAIPAGSTIDGIRASIHRKGDINTDLTLTFSAGGTDAYSSDYADTVTNWGSTESTAIYGGATDLWGTTWNTTLINASNFMLRLQADGDSGSATVPSVDYFEVEVFYTEVAPIEQHRVMFIGI